LAAAEEEEGRKPDMRVEDSNGMVEVRKPNADSPTVIAALGD
jgi:hypothetical protein